tara:strand:+ start:5844 stop:6545 length:702 start_codon:yes stop_codon:yes gene_type:complete
MNKKKFDTCFIMPTFNEQKNIAYLIKRLKKIGDVVIVDDCSTDKTNIISKKNGALVIKHQNNLGYDHALFSGLKKAKKLSYKFAITLDADKQHNINDAKKILKYLKRGNSIVYGERKNFQRLMESIFSFYTSYFKNIKDPLCGLKGYNIKRCLKYGLLDRNNNIGTNVLLNSSKSNLKTHKFKINVNKRKNKSRFGGILVGNAKIFKVFLNMLIIDFINLFNSKYNYKYRDEL